MRALLFSISLFAVMAAGCNEPVAPVSDKGSATNTTDTAAPSEGIPLDLVDAAGLEAALASHSITLVDFTADW